jgi:hypothetical protein
MPMTQALLEHSIEGGRYAKFEAITRYYWCGFC